MAMKRGEAAFTGCFIHLPRPWYGWDNSHNEQSMSLARGWVLLMEILAYLGVLLIKGNRSRSFPMPICSDLEGTLIECTAGVAIAG